MAKHLKPKNTDTRRSRLNQKWKWKTVTTVLSICVALGTTAALMLPAVTMSEPPCELTEHTHSVEDGCYSITMGNGLVCDYDSLSIHRHTADCYDADQNLVCGYSDKLIHTHGSLCYDENGELVCLLPEIEEHEHSADCWSVPETVVDAGYIHDNSCWEWVTSAEPTCGIAESEGHSHGEGCVDADGALICGLDETSGHQHDESCFGSVQGGLICTEEEREPVIETGEPELTCEKEELIAHIHGDGCFFYDEEREEEILICSEIVVESHQHNDVCFAEVETKTLICERPEHTHTSECVLPTECTCGTESEIHTEGCPLSGAQLAENSFYQQLLSSTSLRDIFDSINADTASALDLTDKEVVGLESHITILYGAYETVPEDEEEAYLELLDMILILKENAGIFECTCGSDSNVHDPDCPLYDGQICTCGTEDGIHAESCAFYSLPFERQRRMLYAAPAEDNKADIYTNKTLVGTGDDLTIEIEAWTDGLVRSRPMDVVLLLDHSGSMYRAADGDEPNNTSIAMTYTGFINGGGDTTKGAQHPGYYVAITQRSRVPKVWNWNNETDLWTQYSVSLIRYNGAEQRWEHSAQVQCGTAGDNINTLNISATFREDEEMLWFPLADDPVYTNENGATRARYFKTLYGATIDAFYRVVDDLKTLPNANIAVAGFSSPIGYDSTKIGAGGTGVYIDGVFHNALIDTDLKDHIVQAWETTSQDGLDSISLALQNVRTNYGGTCTEGGFMLVNDLFQAAIDSGISSDDNHRVVIMFTDGEPTCKADSTVTYTGNETTDMNAALAQAYITKNTYGANVYAFGHHALLGTGSDATRRRTFMEYISSAYPEAENLTTPGGSMQGGTTDDNTYFGFVVTSHDFSAQLDAALRNILEASAGETREVYIRDVVTKYFNLDIDASRSIEAYAVPYTTTGFVTDQSEWIDLLAPGSDVVVTKTENADGTATIVVENYDLMENFVNTIDGDGEKILLRIPIVRHPQFIGGNQVPTNIQEQSGVYDAETDRVLSAFPLPKTDVTLLKPTINVPDLYLYLGSTLAKQLLIEDLWDTGIVSEPLSVIINSIGDAENLTLDLNKPSEEYGIDWQDDYAKLSLQILDKDGNVVSSLSDIRDDQTYSVQLVTDPIYEGEIGTDTTPSDTGDITVFYPTLVFQDDKYPFGVPMPNSEQMANRNWLKDNLIWKDSDGTASTEIGMTSKDVPAIELDCIPDYEGQTMPNQDVPVNVKVKKIGYVDDDVQRRCMFDWVVCDPDCGKALVIHNGEAESYEFYLHTQYTVALPETGGAGTFPYILSGWAIIVVASMLIYRTERKKRKEAR